MGLMLLALLCLGQPGAPVFSDAGTGGPSISLGQHGEAAALLRVTGKVQALEVRTGRPAFAKFASGNPALPPPEAIFPLLDRTSPVEPFAAFVAVSASRANANQPRAPPSI
jgi:hypothetical protein